MDLAPPPYVYDDYFTNLIKRVFDTGYRSLKDEVAAVSKPGSSPMRVPASEDSAPAFDELETSRETNITTLGNSPFAFATVGDQSLISEKVTKSLILFSLLVAGGAILLLIYEIFSKPTRKCSKPTKAKAETRSLRSAEIMDGLIPSEYGSQSSNLRRRIKMVQ